MGKTTAVVSLKGGTGKTSISIHLAAALQSRRRSVIVADLDPQESASDWARWGDPFSFDVLAVDTERGVGFIKAELNRLLERADLLICDLPPELGPPSMVACLVADLILIPCAPSALDLRAAFKAQELAVEAREERGGRLPSVSFVPSKLISRTRIASELIETLAEEEESLAPAIFNRVAVAQASADGDTVKPNTPAGQEFASLARHVINRLRSS